MNVTNDGETEKKVLMRKKQNMWKIWNNKELAKDKPTQSRAKKDASNTVILHIKLEYSYTCCLHWHTYNIHTVCSVNSWCDEFDACVIQSFFCFHFKSVKCEKKKAIESINISSTTEFNWILSCCDDAHIFCLPYRLPLLCMSQSQSHMRMANVFLY